jgi:hypothetical protein
MKIVVYRGPKKAVTIGNNTFLKDVPLGVKDNVGSKCLVEGFEEFSIPNTDTYSSGKPILVHPPKSDVKILSSILFCNLVRQVHPTQDIVFIASERWSSIFNMLGIEGVSIQRFYQSKYGYFDREYRFSIQEHLKVLSGNIPTYKILAKSVKLPIETVALPDHTKGNDLHIIGDNHRVGDGESTTYFDPDIFSWTKEKFSKAISNCGLTVCFGENIYSILSLELGIDVLVFTDVPDTHEFRKELRCYGDKVKVSSEKYINSTNIISKLEALARGETLSRKVLIPEKVPKQSDFVAKKSKVNRQGKVTQ